MRIELVRLPAGRSELEWPATAALDADDLAPEDIDALQRAVTSAGFLGLPPEVAKDGTEQDRYSVTLVHSVLMDAATVPTEMREVIDRLTAEATSLSGFETRDWSAGAQSHGIVAPAVGVSGTCSFATSGFQADLRLHKPQPPAKSGLLILDLVVKRPSGPVTEVRTDVPVHYFQYPAIYERVVILPLGTVLDVVSDLPPDLPREGR